MAEAPKYLFSNGYQERILSSVLSDPAFLRQYRDALDPTYFERSEHQTIAALVLTFFDKYGNRPGRDVLLGEFGDYARRLEMTAEEEEKHTREILRLLELVTEPHEVESIKDKVAQFGQHQAVKNAILESVEVISENERDPDNNPLDPVVHKIQKALMVGTASNTGINAAEFLDKLDSIQEFDVVSDPRRRVPTGLKVLDRFLDGGLGAGELGFVIAESNKGKSMVLTNFAAAAYRACKKVIYFTFELKPYEVTTRVAARLSRLRITDDVKKNSDEYVRWTKQWRAGVERLAKSKVPYPSDIRVIYLKPSEATAFKLRATLARVEAEAGWRPDLIVVDYIDEMRGQLGSKAPRDDGETYHTFGQLSADLIELGVDYLCPVWSASQIQREAYAEHGKNAPEGPSISHLSRSIQKVEKAEVIISFYGEGKMRVLKNRRGEKHEGTDQFLSCRVDFSRAFIGEHASRENPDPGATEP